MTFADALYWSPLLIIAAASGLAFTDRISGSHKREHLSCGLYAAGLWLDFVDAVLAASPTRAALAGLFAAWFTWRWWNGRRGGRGRKALRELGAKSRARIEALVERMKPSPIPSPAGGRS